MINRLLLVALAMLLVLLPGCSKPPHARVADVATHVTDPSFEGSWASNAGRSAVVKRDSGDSYLVTISDKTGATTYHVDLLDVAGKRFLEIAVHEPTRKTVPVYMYSRLDIKGNNLTYSRMRNEWLERTAKAMQGVTYKSTGEVQKDTGGVVVKDVAKMQELLEKAAADPAAFGEPEQAHRVK
jgi:hypothetical protein